MRPQTVLIAVLALVLSGSTAVAVRQFLVKRSSGSVATVSVVVAAVDLPSGTTVTAASLTTKAIPKGLSLPNTVPSIDDAIDRATLAPIVKDEPILTNKLGPKGEFGLAPRIPKGMRAFTINTPNVACGVAGFILPGNSVDVLLSVSQTSAQEDESTGGGSSTVLLQNVEILAVDHNLDAPSENKVEAEKLRSVTLLVTPEQSAMLDLGQNKGLLHLALRNPEDEVATDVRPATLNDIKFRRDPPRKPIDERAIDLLKAFGEALAKAPPPPRELPPQPQSKPQQMVKRTIRTLRGGAHEGAVIVQLPSLAPPGGLASGGH